MSSTSLEPMPTLSIRQPWAWLILDGRKDVENRRWRPPAKYVGRRIRIHAGKVRDEDAAQSMYLDVVQRSGEKYRRAANDLLAALQSPRAKHVGALLGEATLVGTVAHSPSPWFFGPYGLVLREPRLYLRPIPWKGRLGFFTTGGRV